ncbi:MAG: hypothetical protein Q4G47_01470 [Lachnospiraceae bacterium]|nr:hypothetical protein [Lachnospiraceae bacterium]
MQLSSRENHILNRAGGAFVLMYLLIRGTGAEGRTAKVLLAAAFAAAAAVTALNVVLQIRDIMRGRGEAQPVPEKCQEHENCAASGTGRGRRAVRAAGAYALDMLELIGRHAAFILAFSFFDKKLSALYERYDKKLPVSLTLHRMLVDVAAAEGIILTAGKVLPLPGVKSDLESFVRNEKALAVTFYISFGVVYGVRFLMSTTFTEFIASDHILRIMYRLGVSVCLLLAAIETGRQKSLIQYAVRAAVLITAILHYRNGGKRYVIYAMLVLIVAASGKNFRTILWISVIEGLLISLAAFAAAKAGYIYYQVRRKDGTERYRYGLGSISPTDFAAHMLYISISWCMLRSFGRRLRNYADYLVMIAFLLISWYVNVARISTGLFLLLIAGTWIRQTMPEGIRETVCGWPAKIFSYICSLSYVVLFFYIVLQIPGKLVDFYIPCEKLLSRFINLETFRQRFIHAHRAYNHYGINLLGTPISEKGNGMRGDTPKRYTFIDFSYARVLLVGGIAVTVVLIGGMTLKMFRLTRRGMYYTVFLLAIVALNCLVEHHLFEFFYNIFPLMFFSKYAERGGGGSLSEV